MSRKRREVARARAADLWQAEQIVEAIEEAAEAAQAERNFVMTSTPEDAILMPKLNRSGGEQVIVWHQPSGKYLPLWTARSLDKAAVNDMVYPDAAPGGEAHLRALGVEEPGEGDCGDCGEADRALVIPRIRRRDKALAVAQGVLARDEEPEEPEPEDQDEEAAGADEDEEAAIGQILAAVERLDAETRPARSDARRAADV